MIDLGTGIYFHSQSLLVLLVVLFYTPQTKQGVFFLSAMIISVFMQNLSLIVFMLARIESYVGLYAVIGFTRLFEVRSVKEYQEAFYTVFCLFI